MRERYPDAEIVRDVGSGLNFRRKGYLPYWNDYTREISSVLWSPTETVLQGLGPNSSRRCSSATAESSWFSISGTSAPKRSSRLTFSPSSRSLELGSTNSGATVRKSRKIRLYPDAGQRAELRRWFGAARYAYNQAVELLSSEDAPKAVKREVRNHILPTLPPWHRSAPREVLVGAIFDACRAVSAVKKRNAELARDKSRGSRQDEDFARVRFRSRKNPRQTFTVQANCVGDSGIYRTKLGDMRMAEKLPTPKNRNICRLSLRYGQYHLDRALRREAAATSARTKRGWLPSTPGVRSFLTWYCCGLCWQDRRGSVLQDTEALREAGRPAEPCCEVTVNKATEHASCRQPDARSG